MKMYSFECKEWIIPKSTFSAFKNDEIYYDHRMLHEIAMVTKVEKTRNESTAERYKNYKIFETKTNYVVSISTNFQNVMIWKNIKKHMTTVWDPCCSTEPKRRTSFFFFLLSRNAKSIFLGWKRLKLLLLASYMKYTPHSTRTLWSIQIQLMFICIFSSEEN